MINVLVGDTTMHCAPTFIRMGRGRACASSTIRYIFVFYVFEPFVVYLVGGTFFFFSARIIQLFQSASCVMNKSPLKCCCYWMNVSGTSTYVLDVCIISIVVLCYWITP